MKLILIGCEYVGTTTLAEGIRSWSHEVMGKGKGRRRLGGGLVAYHDHWKIPHTSGHPGLDDENIFTPEEQEQVLALSPKAKEMIQRHNITYHIAPGALHNPDYLAIGLHIENSIYAPMYFDYLVGDQAWARQGLIDHFEEIIVELAPDIPLVLVKASPETIARRMKESPHHNPVLQEPDIKQVLDEFEEQYERSAIRSKFTIDTSRGTAEETLAQFIEQYEPYLNDHDRLRILTHKVSLMGD